MAEVPSCDRTGLEPDNAANADPGVEMAYWHSVTNRCPSPRAFEIAAHSSLGWPVSIFAADGDTPLADSNHNGSADTRVLEPGQSSLIVVKVAVPPGAGRGQRDTTTVTAEHAGGGQSATARDTTTVNGVITMSLSSPSVTFGGIAPSGSVALAAPGIWSSTDPFGACYVKSEAVSVTVSSNAPWTGTMGARENSGSAATIKIGDGDLKWRSQGESDWSAFAASPSEFAAGSAGVRSYSHDYGLSVSWDDSPGSFDSVVTYNVSQ